MATPSPQKRAAELRERIEKANYEYHVLDQPTIADQAYDALKIFVRAGVDPLLAGHRLRRGQIVVVRV